jgi:hypothetical protein
MVYEAMHAFGDFETTQGKVMPCKCKTFNGSHRAKVSDELAA